MDCMLLNKTSRAGGGLNYESGFFGSVAGDNTSKLKCTVDGHINETAVFVVMHRDVINVDPSWVYLCGCSTTLSDNSTTQYISIYKTKITEDSNTFEIIQNQSARMNSGVFYFTKDINIQYISDIDISERSQRIYNIDINDWSMIIFNFIYIGNASHEFPLDFISPPRIINVGSSRMTALIRNSKIKVTSSANDGDKIHLFKIKY